MSFYKFLRSRDPYELRFLFIEIGLLAFLLAATVFWFSFQKPYHALACVAGAALIASFITREIENLLKQYHEEKDLDSHER